MLTKYILLRAAGALLLVSCAGQSRQSQSSEIPQPQTLPQDPSSETEGEIAALSLPWPPLSATLQGSTGEGKDDAVVIVALERYAFLSPVLGAVQSAEEWREYFIQTRNVPPANVVVLKVKPTASRIEGEIIKAGQKVGANGRLWFIFIGHGASIPNAKVPGGADGLLLDFRALPDEMSGITHKRLMEVMSVRSNMRAQQPVAILDACYSGNIIDENGDLQSSGLPADLWAA